MTAALDMDQVAEVLGVTRRRVEAMAKDGDGPKRNVDGKYPCSDLCDWIKRKAEGGYEGRLTKARAEKAELEVAELSGIPTRRTATRERWSVLMGAFRARLLSIPPTLAPRIAPAGKAAEVQAEISRALEEAMTELADGR